MQVRENNDPKSQSPDYDALLEAAQVAEAAGRGVFQTDPAVKAASVFRFDTSAASDAGLYVATQQKGRPVPGVVDQAGSSPVLLFVKIK